MKTLNIKIVNSWIVMILFCHCWPSISSPSGSNQHKRERKSLEKRTIKRRYNENHSDAEEIDWASDDEETVFKHKSISKSYSWVYHSEIQWINSLSIILFHGRGLFSQSHLWEGGWEQSILKLDLKWYIIVVWSQLALLFGGLFFKLPFGKLFLTESPLEKLKW